MVETDRLIFRKFADGDVEVIHSMRSDPEIMRFIGQVSSGPDDTLRWMDRICGLWDSEGIGYLAMIEKDSGELCGWSGLWKIPETGEIEVAYAVTKPKWGLGYATEAAAAFVGYAFRELDLDRIVAVAFPENRASIKVMEKLGMEYVMTGEFFGKRLVQYAILRGAGDIK